MRDKQDVPIFSTAGFQIPTTVFAASRLAILTATSCSPVDHGRDAGNECDRC